MRTGMFTCARRFPFGGVSERGGGIGSRVVPNEVLTWVKEQDAEELQLLKSPGG